ncbi:hypothetical protein U6A24_03395 [Aquimarina gracilis]|uniref:Uncharacterized protein n=1 Tax=Aquimarina gracilis TaxID=874422 RepID=A0ABU5ZR07_9FLAO|nr:hypothetical protein [Aquimarina gracilis]MEB3344488.1 hypothetical protein [Aquimarina gracilis]
MKKITYLLAISIALLSCEAESFEDATLTQDNNIENPENNPGNDPDINPEKIIDDYNETDGGLDYNTAG